MRAATKDPDTWPSLLTLYDKRCFPGGRSATVFRPATSLHLLDCREAFRRAVLEEHRTPGFLLVAACRMETASLVDQHDLNTGTSVQHVGVYVMSARRGEPQPLSRPNPGICFENPEVSPQAQCHQPETLILFIAGR